MASPSSRMSSESTSCCRIRASSSSLISVSSKALASTPEASCILCQKEMAAHARRRVIRTSRSQSSTGIPFSWAARVASRSSLPGVTPSFMPRRFW